MKKFKCKPSETKVYFIFNLSGMIERADNFLKFIGSFDIVFTCFDT